MSVFSSSKSSFPLRISLYGRTTKNGRSSDSPQSALPSRLLVSGVIQADPLKGDYSCRYSPGFSPDSLSSDGIRPSDCLDLGAKIQLFIDRRCIIHGFFLILHQIHVMMTPKTAFMIAAPTSGSGKTTIARGLMALLSRKGYKVQPFKCGPDYIDTKFHEAVCGRPSINLDTFMATPEHVRELFHHYSAEADVCIVEGMMGLFDGYDRDKGSSYEIARVLDIPVVLVVDAKSAAYSMAALLSGFINFRKDVRFAGIIYNKVGSERHFQMLRQVCDDLNIPCLGYLPKEASLEQGSRYLGLDYSELPENERLITLMDQYIDCKPLLVTLFSLRENVVFPEGKECFPSWKQLVMIARNTESFSFLYQETLDRWADKRFFDPEK